jgi:hypothetical protein
MTGCGLGLTLCGILPIIKPKTNAYSGPNRPLIPNETGH